MTDSAVSSDGKERIPELDCFLNRVFLELTPQITGLKVEPCKEPPIDHEKDWDTVYTLVEGICPLILAIHAQPSLLRQAAVHVWHSEDVSQEDVQECATEFFNVFCGRVVSALYQHLHSSAMLYPPRYVRGRYFPYVEEPIGAILRFTSDQGEVAELRWASPIKLPSEELTAFRSD